MKRYFIYIGIPLLVLANAPAYSQDEHPAVPGYRVNPFDVLEISVYQEPDLYRVARVSQDGTISFPLIGTVRVAGLDARGVEEKLARLLERDYLVHPSVTVFVKEYCDKKVFVLGEVKNPGAYLITENRELSVLESIVLAGGFNDAAAVNRTKVIRVENGEKKVIEVRIDDITRGGDQTRDIILLPGDVVLVPERTF